MAKQAEVMVRQGSVGMSLASGVPLARKQEGLTASDMESGKLKLVGKLAYQRYDLNFG